MKISNNVDHDKLSSPDVTSPDRISTPPISAGFIFFHHTAKDTDTLDSHIIQ